MLARTLVIVGALLATSLMPTAGGHPALAQTPSAAIEIDSATTSIPPGTDTLLSATYTLRNTGTTTIKRGQLAFYPSGSEPIPDAYFFFREWLDGVEQPSPGVTTIFDAGDIAGGTSRVIRFQIIVHSSHNFAADAALVGAPNQTEFARTTIRITADAPHPAQTAMLRIVPRTIGDAGSTVQYRLIITNDSDDALRDVRVGVQGGPSAGLTSVGAPAQFERAGPDAAVSTSLGDIAPHEQFETTLTLESRLPCAYGYPAVLVTGRLYRGAEPREIVALPAMADAGFSLNCADGGGIDYQLPATGAGPDAAPRSMPQMALLLVLSGAALVRLGWRLRRQASDMA